MIQIITEQLKLSLEIYYEILLMRIYYMGDVIFRLPKNLYKYISEVIENFSKDQASNGCFSRGKTLGVNLLSFSRLSIN